MTKQPNCPRCGHEKFVVSTYTLYSYKDPDDGNDCYRQADLLCCDSCGAVIAQYIQDPNKEPKPI
jgi:transcription elongation factor Elf1